MSTDVDDPTEQNVASLVCGILGDLLHLVEQQIQLTRQEIKDEFSQRATSVGVLALGVSVLFLDAFVFCLTLAHLLHWVMSPPGVDPARLPLWACHAVLAALLLVVGVILTHVGRTQFRTCGRCKDSGLEVLTEHVP